MAPRIDPRLGAFARGMRREPTPIEGRLWSHLRRAQLGGFKFRRQAVIGPYIADFFCPQVGLVVELDGQSHEPAYDDRRDAMLASLGFHPLRFANQEVGRNLDGVLTTILGTAQRLPERWPDLPHPRDAASAAPLVPSPEGEGMQTPAPSGEGRRDGEAGPGVGASRPHARPSGRQVAR